MSSQIKFRIWNKREAIWVKQSFITHNGDLHIRLFEEYPDTFIPNEGKFITQRYTGLKDKNGYEIYEGDIIKYNFGTDPEDESTAEVFYDEKYACFCFDKVQQYDFIREDFVCEVVGNIFESQLKNE